MNLNQILNNSIFIIFSLLPLSLLTGPFLADLSISLCGILILIYTYLNKSYEYLNHIIIKIYFIWCIYLIINSIFSHNIILSLESSLFYFRFGFFALAILYILNFDSKKIIYFYYFSFFIIFIILIDSLFQIINGKNILGFEYVQHRLSSFFGKELILGSYISRLIIINFVILFIFLKRNFNAKLIFYIFFPISLLIVLYTGERIALFNMIGVMIFFIIFISEKKYFKFFTVFITFVSLLLIISTNEPIKKRLIDHTFSANQLNLVGDKGRVKIFSSVHEEHYLSAIKIFRDNIYFGVGPKMFRIICKKEEYFSINSCATHPHNYYIQLLTETGIIGTLPLIFFYFFITYNFIKGLYLMFISKYQESFEKRLISYFPIFIFLFPFIPSSNFFNNWVSIFTYISIGFILYFNIRFKKL